MLEGLRSRLNLCVRLLVSVPFHRLWMYGQQIHGIAADSADYLRHHLDKFGAEKGDAKTCGHIKHLYLFLYHLPSPELTQWHITIYTSHAALQSWGGSSGELLSRKGPESAG